MFSDQKKIPSGNRKTISRLKNNLQFKVVCRSKAYLQIKNLFSDYRIICRSKNYVLVKVPFADWRSLPSADRESICRLKKYLQIKELSADWINIFCRFKSYLQINEVSIWYADQKTIRRLKNYQYIKVRSADISSICRQVFNLLIVVLSANTYSIYRLNASSICR